jgi:hypothetical protein
MIHLLFLLIIFYFQCYKTISVYFYFVIEFHTSIFINTQCFYTEPEYLTNNIKITLTKLNVKKYIKVEISRK